MKKVICIIQNRIIDNSCGGYEIQIYNICLALYSSGWTIYYICEGENSRCYNIENVINVIQIPKKYFLSFYNREVFRNLDKIQPDIIYQRSRTGFSCGLLGARYAARHKITYVFGIGSADDLIPYFLTKSLWSQKDISILRKSLLVIDALIKDFLFQKNYIYADTILSQNINQQETCYKLYGRKSFILQSIHMPVVHNIQKASPPLVSWICNVRPLKQPELFYELILKFRDLGEQERIQFIMVFGKNIHKYNYCKLIDSLKQLKYVKIYGALTIEEANHIMEISTVLVNTSLYEGFSNTFVQAWLRETPVVSLNSDPDDIMKKEQIGFHSKTLERMIQDVRYLIENPEICKAMGKKARNYAESNHSIAAVSKKIDFLFNLETKKKKKKNHSF